MKRREPRERDPAYCGWVAKLPCAICMVKGHFNRQVQVAHLRVGSLDHNKRHTGMGEKPHDRWTTPLCMPHHQGDKSKVRLSQDDRGELHFWAHHGIDPFDLCLALNEAYATGQPGAPIIVRFAAQGRKLMEPFSETTVVIDDFGNVTRTIHPPGKRP